MLPNYETCRKHILAYKRRNAPTPHNTISFQQFWEYKIHLENNGENILGQKHVAKTAAMLRSLLINLKIRNFSQADGQLEDLLVNASPCYSEIYGLSLGSGQIQSYKGPIEMLYTGLGQKEPAGPDNNSELSIAVKSAILMAIWGQVPRFDTLNRVRFEKWNHWPSPEKLPYLRSRVIRYPPDQFCAMVAELDRWILAWPETNYGKLFSSSFSDLCPGAPPGRLIDIIYHWKLPQSWPKCRLQTQGSGIALAGDSSVDEYQ